MRKTYEKLSPIPRTVLALCFGLIGFGITALYTSGGGLGRGGLLIALAVAIAITISVRLLPFR
jgi:hypothetical protein